MESATAPETERITAFKQLWVYAQGRSAGPSEAKFGLVRPQVMRVTY